MNKKQWKAISKRDIKRTKDIISLALRDDITVCAYGAGKIGRTFGKEILDYFGIRIDFYCDSNPSLIGTTIVDGIMCREREYVLREKANTVFFVLVGYADIEAVVELLMNEGVDRFVTYDDLCELPEILEHYLPFLDNHKIAVYTCITGGYDLPREPQHFSDNCDYYLLSDEKPKAGSSYRWVDIKNIVPRDIVDPIYQNRYCKILPHLFLSDYRYSIYVDGNITITGDLSRFVNKLRSARIGFMGGNFTNNYYTHGMRCIKMGADYETKLEKQMRDYYLQGMPANVGSYYCGIIVREHNNPICISLMSDWWNEFVKYSKRDQISMPYILWKNGYSRDDVYVASEEEIQGVYYDNPYWEYDKKHRKERFCVKSTSTLKS